MTYFLIVVIYNVDKNEMGKNYEIKKNLVDLPIPYSYYNISAHSLHSRRKANG